MSQQNPQSTPGHAKPMPGQAEEADHTLQEEAPLGWDIAPTGGNEQSDGDPENGEIPHRHPRVGGKGGTPDRELGLDESQDGTVAEHKE